MSWTVAIRGYHTDSADLPYLLDPMFERLGSGARLWLSEVGQPHFEDAIRVASNEWTAVEEWRRPAWVGGPAEVRVRLRFALIAAAHACPDPVEAAHLRTISLADLAKAAARLEHLDGGAPHAVALAAMAVRSAAPAAGSVAGVMDLVSRRYPIYAWYAAMAAACAATDLTAAAEAAVHCESRRASWRRLAAG